MLKTIPCDLKPTTPFSRWNYIKAYLVDLRRAFKKAQGKKNTTYKNRNFGIIICPLYLNVVSCHRMPSFILSLYRLLLIPNAARRNDG